MPSTPPANPTTLVQKSGSSIATSLTAPPDTTKEAFEKLADAEERELFPLG
jgi:hypothetical protein